MKLTGEEDDETDEVNFSIAIAAVMLVIYFGYVYHTVMDEIGEGGGEGGAGSAGSAGDGGDGGDAGYLRSGEGIAAAEGASNGGESSVSLLLSPPLKRPLKQKSDGGAVAEPLTLSYYACLCHLFLITFVVSLLSDVMVGTIDDFTSRNSINPVFVAAVIIPIFGNGCEHMAAVLFAYRNNLDLCLSIAVGSSIQITMLLLPLLILASAATNRELTLFMEGYETACMVVACSVVASVVQAGRSNWMTGLGLVGLFVIMAAGFVIHRRENVGEVVPKKSWVDSG